jgi:hypothetical protein
MKGLEEKEAKLMIAFDPATVTTKTAKTKTATMKSGTVKSNTDEEKIKKTIQLNASVLTSVFK